MRHGPVSHSYTWPFCIVCPRATPQLYSAHQSIYLLKWPNTAEICHLSVRKTQKWTQLPVSLKMLICVSSWSYLCRFRRWCIKLVKLFRKRPKICDMVTIATSWILVNLRCQGCTSEFSRSYYARLCYYRYNKWIDAGSKLWYRVLPKDSRLPWTYIDKKLFF